MKKNPFDTSPKTPIRLFSKGLAKAGTTPKSIRQTSRNYGECDESTFSPEISAQPDVTSKHDGKYGSASKSSLSRQLFAVKNECNKSQDQKIFIEILAACMRTTLEEASIFRNDISFDQTGFVYLNQDMENAKRTSSQYCLRVVPYRERFESEYFTMSPSGITHFVDGKMADFITLEQWKRERDIYDAITKIPVFKSFRTWKPFFSWKRVVTKGNKKQCYMLLEDHFSQKHQPLFVGLKNIRQMWLELEREVPAIFDRCFEDNLQMTVHDFSRDQSKRTHDVLNRIGTVFESNIAALQEVFSAVAETVSFPALVEPGSSTVAAAAVQSRTLSSNALHKMNYAERATRHAIQQRLFSFTLLCDYVVASSLHNIAFNSIFDLHKKIDPSCSTCLPLFLTDVHFDNSGISLLPNFVEFTTEIEGIGRFLGRELVCTCGVAFVKHPNLRLFWESAVEEEKNSIIKEILAGDQQLNLKLNSLHDFCKKVYSQAMETLQELFDDVHPHSHFISCDLAEIEKEASECFSKLIEKTKNLKEFQAKIKAIPESISIFFLQLMCSKTKDRLLSAPTKCLSQLEDAAVSLLSRERDALSEYMVEAASKLTKPCRSIDDFIALRLFAIDIEVHLPKLEGEVEDISTRLQTLVELDMNIPNKVLSWFSFLSVQLDTIKSDIDSANDMFYRKKNYWSDILDAEMRMTEQIIPTIKTKIQESIYLDSAKNMHMETKELAVCVSEMLETSKQHSKWCQVLGVVKENSTDLENLYSQVLLRTHLWDLYESTQEEISISLKKYVKDFLVEAGKSKVQEWSAFLMRAKRELPPNPLMEKVKEQVDTYKQLVDVCVYLLNPAMKSRHWEKIYLLTGHRVNPFRSTYPADFITVGQIFELQNIGMVFYRVSQDATEEHALESVVSKLQADWSQKEFSLIRYIGRDDVHILGDTDELQKVLDESMSSIAAVLASKQAEAVRADAELQQSALREIQNYLDQWTPIQLSWIHLEPIFTSTDIQRQLPSEAKQFSLIEREFKKVMSRALENPNCVKLCNTKGLREIFNQLQHSFERIRRSLQDYLEMKRMAFPRFFFLSDDELLQMLAQSRDINVVQVHISKCFQGVKRFILAERVVSANSFASTVNGFASTSSLMVHSNQTFLTDTFPASGTYLILDIQGMVSNEDEIVYFDNPIKVMCVVLPL